MKGTRKTRADEMPAGSPGKGEPVFLVVGKVRRPHGLKGELLMDVYTDFPERLHPGATVFLGEKHTPMCIHSQRWQGQSLLIAFKGFHEIEAVKEFRNQLVFVRVQDLPALPEGEYYHHELLGLRVVSDEGQELGILAQILETNANDVYVVRSESGAEILLPAIESVILNINLQEGKMHVHILPGLLPDDR